MRLFGAFLLVLIISGCKKEKRVAPDAFFIDTGAVSVNTVSSQGTSSNKISDLWVYVDGNFAGAYPAGNILTIPCSNDHARVTVFAGIKNNGISFTRIPYDFYQSIEIDTNVKAGSVVNRDFTFYYKSGAKFTFIESFEGGSSGINMSAGLGSDLATFNLDNSSASFEGGCMQFGLDPVNQIAIFQSNYTFALPQGGTAVYLEMNYKCDQAFEVGVYSSDGSLKRAAFVNASQEWNKIYVLLSPAIATNPVTTNQGFYLKAVRNKSTGNETPQFYIDNIKIVNF